MPSILPLQIHPWPVDEATMTRIKEAKAALELDVKVLPTKAVPGLHARVLALGELPGWLCDAAFVSDPTSRESLSAALEWLLTAPSGDQRGFMVSDYLEAIFGEGVRELAPPSCRCWESGCERPVAARHGETLDGRCAPCFDAGCHLAKGLCLRD